MTDFNSKLKLSEERVSESKEIPGDISVKRLRIKTEKKMTYQTILR